MTLGMCHTTLQVEGDAPGIIGVAVDGLGPDHMIALRRYVDDGGSLQAVLRVSVVQSPSPHCDELPGVASRYELLDAGLHFLPAFPFERGPWFEADFDPRTVEGLDDVENQARTFAFEPAPSLPPPRVEAMYPSGDALPANLLRFYVLFSNPMQRGSAKANISVLDAEGGQVSDVLYNAPVELWDRTMQRLTVLLDPGRLKRGVGPNRALGPPLVVGRQYTLVIETGMTDASGGSLPGPARKPFHVTEAVRTPIATDRWRVAAPEAVGREPLTLGFETALDWGLLSHAITVETAGGRRLDGRIAIGADEQAWSFRPMTPWIAGSYQLRISPGLEDVCGNTAASPFDRPLRSDAEVGRAQALFSIGFNIA